jgi:hypothetical protein
VKSTLSARQRGLAHAGHVLDQQVAAREQRGDGELDRLALAFQHLAHVRDQRVREPDRSLGVHISDLVARHTL